MESLNTFLNDTYWLWRWIPLLIGGLVIWVIAAVPARMLYPLARTCARQLAAKSRLLADTIERRRSERKADDRSSIEALSAELPLRQTALTERPFTDEAPSLAPIVKTLASVDTSLKKTYARIDRLAAQLDEATRLPAVANRPTDPISELAQEKNWWVSVVSLLVFSTLAIALMVVNTGLLSQILFSFPGFQVRYLGVSLSVVFALLLTIVEAGLGSAHTFLSERDSSRESRSSMPLGAIVVLVFGLGIAVVEGMFYALIGDPLVKVAIPFFGTDLDQQQQFFIWGFVLVGALFTMGLLWFKNLLWIARSTAVRGYEKRVRAVTRHLYAQEELARDVDRAMVRVKDSVTSVLTLCRDVSTSPIIKELQEYERRIEAADGALSHPLIPD